MNSDLHAGWSSASLGLRRSLGLAHASLLAGGLPVGSVVLR
jgi:hypothetical protein